MPAPIYDALLAQAACGRVPLHMPGHKNTPGSALPPELAAFLRLDSTELPGTGDLFAGFGAIREAEALAADLFGTAQTLFSAGGATLCIQAMLRCALPHGGKLICGRVLHRAAADAFCLLGIEPVFPDCDGSAGGHFPGRVTPQALKSALRQHPDARAVYVTCPDYFGTLSDLSSLAKAAHAVGLPLLVDAAHGAHLDFLNAARGAVTAGADFAAESAHKTLPALTGAAWLHLAHASDTDSARHAMRMFGSSSPSFPILLSLDCARAWLAERGAYELARLAERVAISKTLLEKLGFLQPPGDVDPLRIAFAVPKDCGAGRFLRENGIEPEYAEQGKVILIPGAANGIDDFARLGTALSALAVELEAFLPCDETSPKFPIPQRIMSPREAFLASVICVPVDRAVGKISARNIIPCPPAVPIVLAGEEINGTVVGALAAAGIDSVLVASEA
ncbi:MAG: DegT/DnrJ/EryC1/StrS family aminotransferase [Oscillospiraceae bacterium]|jgi:arginine/lysine/ornithine decarboxylase|nr:DegT/DnrJ/EryC1/StrS family aminotransferase [Oscillospiraceae bacterium]